MQTNCEVTMASGFITNPTAVSGIGTSFAVGKAIELTYSVAADANSRAMPQACMWDHIEIEVTPTTAAQVSAMLCWDATGDKIAAGPTALKDLQACLTTVAKSMVAKSIDGWFAAPAVQSTVQKVYLFLKTDAGTIDVAIGAVRLNWAEVSGKG